MVFGSHQTVRVPGLGQRLWKEAEVQGAGFTGWILSKSSLVLTVFPT